MSQEAQAELLKQFDIKRFGLKRHGKDISLLNRAVRVLNLGATPAEVD